MFPSSSQLPSLIDRYDSSKQTRKISEKNLHNHHYYNYHNHHQESEEQKQKRKNHQPKYNRQRRDHFSSVNNEHLRFSLDADDVGFLVQQNESSRKKLSKNSARLDNVRDAINLNKRTDSFIGRPLQILPIDNVTATIGRTAILKCITNHHGLFQVRQSNDF